ncbi:MAG: hypothetical protein V1779_11685 [bacterium]
MTKAIIIAISLTFLNALSSFIIDRIAMNKDWKSFNKLIFGSMAIKYFLTAGLVWFCVSYLELHKLAFSLTFLVSTFFLLMGEIMMIHKYKSGKR